MVSSRQKSDADVGDVFETVEPPRAIAWWMMSFVGRVLSETGLPSCGCFCGPLSLLAGQDCL